MEGTLSTGFYEGAKEVSVMAKCFYCGEEKKLSRFHLSSGKGKFTVKACQDCIIEYT